MHIIHIIYTVHIIYTTIHSTYHGVELHVRHRTLALEQLKASQLMPSILVPVSNHSIGASGGEGVIGMEVQCVHAEDVRAVPNVYMYVYMCVYV